MTDRTVAQAFADAMSALVDEHEIADVLAQLVADCALVYPADAVAIMVTDRDETLELLSATSHRAAELELLQVQNDRGPCVEAVLSDKAVSSAGAADMRARWGEVGAAITDAGFCSVHAFPMHWRGLVFGGLNFFMVDEVALSGESAVVGQMFADIATLVVVRSTDVTSERVAASIHEAVAARAVVEQAKGVIAYDEDVDLATAYDLLLQRTRTDGASLGEMARRIVSDAGSPSGDAAS